MVRYLAIILVLLCGCTPEEDNSAFKQGKAAAEAGVPAEANPYQGMRRHALDAKLWLDGWIEGNSKSR